VDNETKVFLLATSKKVLLLGALKPVLRVFYFKLKGII
jgi:hypothetical protein